jgi:hypothetical protein
MTAREIGTYWAAIGQTPRKAVDTSLQQATQVGDIYHHVLSCHSPAPHSLHYRAYLLPTLVLLRLFNYNWERPKIGT